MIEQIRQFCTFRVARLILGIDVRQVQEVIRYQRMTRVPLAGDAVAGLINLRGQIVTAIDLRRVFGLAERTDNRLPMNVVVRDGEGAVSFLVDEIGDVVEVAEDALEEIPATLRGPYRTLFDGAYKLDGFLLLVLNSEEAVNDIGSRYSLTTK
jgi:purine-binding chemotaxis protein CheW